MRYSPDDIKRHLQGHRTSGLSMRAYCRRHGLNYWTFREWQKRRIPTSASLAVPQFLKFDLPKVSVIEIVTGSGATIRIPAEVEPLALRQILCAVKHSRIV
jgi:hypothetical protein